MALLSASNLSEAPRSGRSTLVFVHGFMGTPADFEPMVARLRPRFHCVGVELAGHGQTPLPHTPLGLARMARELRDEVLKPLDAPTLIGYSMGGRLALQCALDHPHSVSNLILISTSPGIEGPEARAKRRAQDAQRAARIGHEFDAFLDEWYRLTIFGGLRQAPNFDAMLARRRAQDPKAIARVITELSPGLQPSNWGRLGALLDGPPRSMWLVGAEDPKYHKLGQDLAASGHRVRTAAHAAHALHIERPDWVAAEIEKLVLSASP